MRFDVGRKSWAEGGVCLLERIREDLVEVTRGLGSGVRWERRGALCLRSGDGQWALEGMGEARWMPEEDGEMVQGAEGPMAQVRL